MSMQAFSISKIIIIIMLLLQIDERRDLTSAMQLFTAMGPLAVWLYTAMSLYTYKLTGFSNILKTM